jgi:hypothetical protein
MMCQMLTEFMSVRNADSWQSLIFKIILTLVKSKYLLKITSGMVELVAGKGILSLSWKGFHLYVFIDGMISLLIKF